MALARRTCRVVLLSFVVFLFLFILSTATESCEKGKDGECNDSEELEHGKDKYKVGKLHSKSMASLTDTSAQGISSWVVTM